jgi:hypothetical protein
VSIDLERRIAEALAARAELVEKANDATGWEGLAARSASTRPRSAARRWQAPMASAAGLVTVAVLAATLVSGRTSVDRVASPPAVASALASTATSAGPGTAVSDGAGAPTAVPGLTGPAGQLVVPTSPAVGVAYPFDLLTHCGVLGAYIGGVYFAAEQPLINGPAGRLAGWANPYQRGAMTLLSATQAEFADTAGHTARFHLDPNTAPPPPCA